MSWRDQIKPQAVIVQRAVCAGPGKELLDLLVDTFQKGDLMRDTDRDTCYALGQFELVEYLKELRDLELTE